MGTISRPCHQAESLATAGTKYLAGGAAVARTAGSKYLTSSAAAGAPASAPALAAAPADTPPAAGGGAAAAAPARSSFKFAHSAASPQTPAAVAPKRSKRMDAILKTVDAVISQDVGANSLESGISGHGTQGQDMDMEGMDGVGWC